MTPHTGLVNLLAKNKCKVAFKDHNDKFMYLWIKYDALVKNSPNQGLEVMGRNQAIFDKIATAVRKYYPTAELSSQDGRASVVYKITNNNPTSAPKDYITPSSTVNEVSSKSSKRK